MLKVYSQRSVDIDVNNFNYHPAGGTRVLAAGDDGGDGVLPGASAYLHALVTVYHISPASALTLVPAFLVVESHQLVQSEVRLVGFSQYYFRIAHKSIRWRFLN